MSRTRCDSPGPMRAPVRAGEPAWWPEEWLLFSEASRQVSAPFTQARCRPRSRKGRNRKISGRRITAAAPDNGEYRGVRVAPQRILQTGETPIQRRNLRTNALAGHWHTIICNCSRRPCSAFPHQQQWILSKQMRYHLSLWRRLRHFPGVVRHERRKRPARVKILAPRPANTG